jgi:dihydroorotate dehydrogenase (fumarate)
MESLLRIRWIALIRGRVDLSIAATGGFHQSDDIVKALLVGADITHLCSVLLQKGPEYIAVLKQELNDWLEQHEYESVRQMKGSVSQPCAINPAALEHCNYMHVIKSYDQ